MGAEAEVWDICTGRIIEWKTHSITLNGFSIQKNPEWTRGGSFYFGKSLAEVG